MILQMHVDLILTHTEVVNQIATRRELLQEKASHAPHIRLRGYSLVSLSNFWTLIFMVPSLRGDGWVV